MFIPRHPVVENQFCQFNETSTTGGIGGVLAYAGAVCYMVSTATNQESIVDIYRHPEPTNAEERIPFGFLMQKVKTGYHQVHPQGFVMPGDLGSSDVIAQPKFNSNGVLTGTKYAPVGVAHLGIFDTIHYMVTYTGGTPVSGTATGTSTMLPGQRLYVCNDSGAVTGAGASRVTNVSATGSSYGTFTNVTTAVARVLKGASAAQTAANINNTTLYPIRIKLLI
jgi:hypothetical protein